MFRFLKEKGQEKIKGCELKLSIVLAEKSQERQSL